MTSARTSVPSGYAGLAAAHELLERFDIAWRSGSPPRLEEFLAAASGAGANVEEAGHGSLLVELIKIDLEYRWRRVDREGVETSPGAGGTTPESSDLPPRPRLEDYVRRFVDLGPLERLPVELIGEEYRVRQRWGDRPGHAEYAARFATQGASLAEVLAQIDAELAAESGPSRCAIAENLATPPEGSTALLCPHCHLPIEHMAEPLPRASPEPNGDSQGHGAIVPRGKERGRVNLVAGSGAQSTSELQALLRKRLLIAAVVIPFGTASYLIVTFLIHWDSLLANPIEFLYDFLAPLSEVFIFSFCAAVLSFNPLLSLSRLRVVEMVLLGWSVVYNCSVTWAFFHKYPESYGSQNILSCAALLFWFTTIVVYGVGVPNTARRCAAVVGTVALIACVFSIIVWLKSPVPRDQLVPWTTNMIIWLAIAIALVVFGAHRLETLHRQAVEARKFGQYVLKERLGAGSMGEVYLAEHVLLRRPCAIKLIQPESAGDPKNLLRFEREVQTTASLTHPNTVQIFDYGHAQDGTFYYVMEYLPGLTLYDLVNVHGPLPAARAVHFLRQVCWALREAHAVGLIHRDIKPSNVIICERGGLHDVAKLLDFGLVQGTGVGADPERLTAEGAIAGTPAYLSPEQARERQNLDGRSDIYCVGALAYFLLTGQSPFAGRSAVGMLLAHMSERPVPLTRHRPDVPAELEAVVLRCLAKDPGERFADAESLDTALAACQRAGLWTENEAAHWWRSHSDLERRVGREDGGT